MALQLRRFLLPSGCSIGPTMLQNRLHRSFPATHLTNLVAAHGKGYGKKVCVAVKNNLSKTANGHIAIRASTQHEFVVPSFSSYPINQFSSGYRKIEVGSCLRIDTLASELVHRRFFATKNRKKANSKLKSNDIGDTRTIENRNIGDGGSGFECNMKREKMPVSCNSINGETNAAVAEPSKKRSPKTAKATTSRTSKTTTSKTAKTTVATSEPAKVEGRIENDVSQNKTSNNNSAQSSDIPKKNKKTSSKGQGKKTSASTQGTTTKATTLRTKSKGKDSTSTVSSSEVKALSQNSPTVGTPDGNKQLRPLYPPSGKSVLVVESVTKAKVIQNYLGEMFEVLPSYGHVRDLAARSRSVRPDDDFSMVWEVPAAAWTHLKSIRVALNGADNLILASDPDREGEAIAWHIMEMLQQQDALTADITVSRVVFHEITESSIKTSLLSPREIDMNLVNAYLARRALDYLIGFSISPLLWRKLPGCQSAGRVQSAALALICERELEIEKFNEQEYWTVGAEFQIGFDHNSSPVTSHLTHLNSKKLDQFFVRSREEAEAIEQQLSSANFEVSNIRRSKVQKNPPMPYITSTLQQDAANKLNFTAAYTMKLAQKLYEGVKLSNEEATGLITYMRTDGLYISNEAAGEIHCVVKERYGEEYASKSIRKYSKKVKNAQEAHEAIRPTSIRRLPSNLVGVLDDDSLKLYTLIWSRTMACQMEASSTDMIQVDISNTNGDIVLRSNGSRIGFLGYRAVYEDKEAQIKENDEKEDLHAVSFDILEKLKVNDSLKMVGVQLKQHYTKPPARYSEGMLVKKLEELGIGRPSTYASILKVLQDRNYVRTKNRTLHPEFRGRMVSSFLSHHFSEVANYSFTADMENELDNISGGTTEWKGLLKDYWSRFSKYCTAAGSTDVRKVERMLEDAFGHVLFASLSSRVCPSCSMGTLRFKVSRFGAGYFIGCDQHPKCKYIAGELCAEDDEEDSPEKIEKSFPPKLLGTYPGSVEKVYLKNGPYGFYVQKGEDCKGFTPKRASLSEVKDVESMTLEDAVELLQYPIPVGTHPEDGYPVVVAHSKFGYSVKHRRTVSPIPKKMDPKKITLEAALELLSSKKAKRFGRPKGKKKSEEALCDSD